MRLGLLAFVVLALGGAAQAAAPVQGDWRPLFNGKDLSGWRGFKAAAAPTRWRVEDGAITLGVEGGGGDLVTAESFGEFELELEWKIAPGGNSGIIYFVQETPAAATTYATGPEMQVLDDARHPDGKLASHRAGALYDLIPARVAAAGPVGEWNKARIVARRGRIEHWLNGRRVVAVRHGDAGWNRLVAESKFAGMAEFAKVARGHVALQDHGDRVWYRNIRVRSF